MAAPEDTKSVARGPPCERKRPPPLDLGSASSLVPSAPWANMSQEELLRVTREAAREATREAASRRPKAPRRSTLSLATPLKRTSPSQRRAQPAAMGSRGCNCS